MLSIQITHMELLTFLQKFMEAYHDSFGIYPKLVARPSDISIEEPFKDNNGELRAMNVSEGIWDVSFNDMMLKRIGARTCFTDIMRLYLTHLERRSDKDTAKNVLSHVQALVAKFLPGQILALQPTPPENLNGAST